MSEGYGMHAPAAHGRMRPSGCICAHSQTMAQSQTHTSPHHAMQCLCEYMQQQGQKEKLAAKSAWAAACKVSLGCSLHASQACAANRHHGITARMVPRQHVHMEQSRGGPHAHMEHIAWNHRAVCDPPLGVSRSDASTVADRNPVSLWYNA